MKTSGFNGAYRMENTRFRFAGADSEAKTIVQRTTKNRTHEKTIGTASLFSALASCSGGGFLSPFAKGAGEIFFGPEDSVSTSQGANLPKRNYKMES